MSEKEILIVGTVTKKTDDFIHVYFPGMGHDRVKIDEYMEVDSIVKGVNVRVLLDFVDGEVSFGEITRIDSRLTTDDVRRIDSQKSMKQSELGCATQIACGFSMTPILIMLLFPAAMEVWIVIILLATTGGLFVLSFILFAMQKVRSGSAYLALRPPETQSQIDEVGGLDDGSV